jgi:hypothetical protein
MEKNIKSVSIRRDGKKFLVSSDYIRPVKDDEGEVISAWETSADSYYEALALLINPQDFNFEQLEKECLMLNAPIDAEWEFIDEYMERTGYSRQTVYDKFKTGLLEKGKLKKYTIVREINNSDSSS